MNIQCVLFTLLCLISIVQNHILPQSTSTHHGLYDPTDNVIELNATTFDNFVYNQSYASFIEFYNAYCGHCRKFAPKWKAFAIDLLDWRDVVAIGALDCSSDANNELCREYEVMAYPSIRYFPPNHRKIPKELGLEIEEQEPDGIQISLVNLLKNETNPSNNWPNLLPLEENTLTNLFAGTPDTVQYIFLVYPNPGSLVGYEVALDLHVIQQIQIRQVESTSVARNLDLNERPAVYAIDRNNKQVLVPIAQSDRKNIRSAIRNFIHNRISNIPLTNFERLKLNGNENNEKEIDSTTLAKDRDQEIFEIKKKINSKKGFTFLADLEMALKTTLFTEVPRHYEINGDRLVALQRYINVLNRYSFLTGKQRSFFKELDDYVLGSEEIKGEYFEAKIKRLKIKYEPILTATNYVGCISSEPHLRGYTCGLWILFHQLTVQAADTEESHDPLEVLQAIHEYIKYFFGCSQCSSHFQEMAKENDIWGVKNKDDAILWLWSAHNEVNKRLKGDPTDDPMFPKIQFPSLNMCPTCRRKSIYNHSDDYEWDKQEVLNFLKRVYAVQNLSTYGNTDTNTAIPYFPAAALRAQRSLGRAFSEIDLRVGILLYVFCIGMLVLAVRMFIRKRSFKKKPHYEYMNGA